ncbi:phosphoadenosine phosphosulfate reductase family protein [Sphingobacterium thalpophilum]|uniref:phosphoadenosine phosphosulfate reductase domain-containing protein n=1 Tax=Sphingobacterium thalpophilum TaxID=259 RepID=UPI0024A6ABE0|nr:phosphoadenosine phosphosulfate reductase family protein [Sphingobacterium thalpophilum]
MMPLEILRKVRSETDGIILFSSLNGKDSILLTDMCCKVFDRVVSVYLYTVKDLFHIEAFKRAHKRRYKNLTFIERPHFALYGYQKQNYLGFTGSEKFRRRTLAQITQDVKKETGIDWACFGFKRSDGLQRRLMMMALEKKGTPGYNPKTKNIYPIENWKNGHVLAYIEKMRLPRPTVYDLNHQSQGVAPGDLNFLLWCKRNCPEDYRKVLDAFPEAAAIVFEHEYNEE